MGIFSDIIAEKETAIKIVDDELVFAVRLKRQASTKKEKDNVENDVIQRLLRKRDDIFDQAYERIMDSPEMQKSLNALRAATHDMVTVAKRMNTVTDFLEKTADFLGAADKVIKALKK